MYVCIWCMRENLSGKKYTAVRPQQALFVSNVVLEETEIIALTRVRSTLLTGLQW